MNDGGSKRRPQELGKAIDEAGETGTLRLSGVDLSGGVPEAIRALRNLTLLHLSRCQLTSVPDWLADLPQLQSLDLDGNPLGSVPEAVLELTNLRRLGLCQCRIRTLPDRFDALRELEALTLAGNLLEDLPPTFRALTELQLLDLGDNRLRAIPESVGGLENLTHLFLWGNPLRDLIALRRGLPRLQALEMSSGGTSELRRTAERSFGESALYRRYSDPAGFGLGRLVGATEHRSELSVPDWLAAALPNLRALFLGGRGLTEIPPGLRGMTTLAGLYLENNSISSIPSWFTELQSLQELSLPDNQLSSIPSWFTELQSMRELSLPDNHLDDVSALANLPHLRYLRLAGNPLPIPPEIIDREHDPQVLLGYLRRVETDRRPLNEAKLVVVGEGSVGKTSLVRQLTDRPFRKAESKTEGIDITRWKVDVDGTETALNIWDFGGQEIMHATHQFFLTKRSIYLVVVDSRQSEEQNRIEYWLRLVQGFSDHSPVIIVGNKTDQAVLDLDRRGLMNKYPDIIGIVETSCSSGAGVDTLRREITQTISRLPHVRDLVPGAFFAVKQHLEQLDADYLPYHSYQQLCLDNDVAVRAEQELLVNFLHDLGTVLCFRDDPRLADTNILNPSWVTGGVYRLLNSHRAAQRKGLLSWKDVDSILDLDAYPAERRIFIIDMMKKFELCFEADQIFLVPDLLTKEEPDTGSWAGALNFSIRYPVLPSSVLSRLIVRMNAAVSHGTVWRTGAVFALDDNRALVRADLEDGVVTILVDGPSHGRRGILTALRGELRAIEQTIPGLAGEERVPVPGHLSHWVPYTHLLNLERAGYPTVIPEGLTREFSIFQLLDGVESPDNRQNTVGYGGSAEVSGSAPASQAAADLAWTPRQSITLGAFLVTAATLLLGVSAGTYAWIGLAAAGASAGVLAIVVVIALVLLRSSGRISEAGLLTGLSTATKPGDTSAQPPPEG